MINIILLALAFIVLIIGSFTDIKIREVPDWINYGLIFSAIGIRAVYSAAASDTSYVLQGILGLAVFIAFAYIMFYAGQWGGGDAKLLMGLGAVFGLTLTLKPMPLILIFIINTLIAGAFYGLFYSIILAVKHRKRFIKRFIKIIHEKAMIKTRKIILLILIFLIILILVLINDLIAKWLLILLVLLAYIFFYLIIFIKAVEQTAMLKYVYPEELTEGDWIVKNIIIDKKKITGPRDLGISKEKIKRLIAYKKQGRIKKILIKQGIPFVPSFLIAFIITIWIGAWWIYLF